MARMKNNDFFRVLATTRRNWYNSWCASLLSLFRIGTYLLPHVSKQKRARWPDRVMAVARTSTTTATAMTTKTKTKTMTMTPTAAAVSKGMSVLRLADVLPMIHTPTPALTKGCFRFFVSPPAGVGQLLKPSS